MYAERDQFNRVVFPAIEERLKGRRCRLQQIYLRVGVETDSTKMERERGVRMLKVCLAEIERSRRFAPQIRESLQGMVGLGRNSHACTG